MTLENSNDTTGEKATAPRARRRVTRETSSPQGGTSAPAATAPVAETPAVTTGSASTTTGTAAVRADAAPAAPRRSRRVVRDGSAAATPAAQAPAESTATAVPERAADQKLDVLAELGTDAAPAVKKPRRSTRTKSAPAVEDAAPEAPAASPAGTELAAAEPATPEPASKPARSRRASRPAAAAEPTPEAAPVAPVAAEEAAAPVAKATRSRTTKRAPKAVAAEVPEVAVEAPARRSRSRKAVVEPAATTEPAAAPEATSAPTTTRSAAPARNQGGSAVREQDAPRTSPRLATTALLFQAPDTTARRPRRVQAPAGPPRAEVVMPVFAQPAKSEAATSEQTHAAPTRAERSAAPERTATAERSGSRRSRGGSKSASATRAEARDETSAAVVVDEPAADVTAEPVTTAQAEESAPSTRGSRRSGRQRAASRPAGPAGGGASTPAAEPTPAVEAVEVETVISDDDLAAIEEVELIEAELVAEGVEIPADVLEPESEPEPEAADADGDAADGDAGDGDEESYTDTDDRPGAPRRRRRRGGRGRRRGGELRDGEESDEAVGDAPEQYEDAADDQPVDAAPAAEDDTTDEAAGADETDADQDDAFDEQGEGSGTSRRRRRRRRGGRGEPGEPTGTSTSTTGSTRASRTRSVSDEVTALKGSTRLEAKRQRRREGRDAGRRRQIITEAEFLARREAVERSMVVREKNGRTQIAVLEDGILVEHYVSQQSQASMVGNVYLGRVQNVLPSMEAAFIDVGKGRNAVLYAGEVNWNAAGLDGQPRRIEQALKSGDPVLVQVTKDPIGHKGARLTSQVTLAGRYLVYVPGGGMTGISRKLPDTERARLKKILKEVVPEGAGVIVRTAAEGASETELRADVERLQNQWTAIEKKSKSANAPALLQGEPDMAIRVVRDIFNDDFSSLVVQGDGAWDEISGYVGDLAPDLADRVSNWSSTTDVFSVHRIDEQLSKGLDRKVWLPSGGSLVIDRTEAMTVVDVNTGKFTGSGGTLEETVTRNNIEAAEEIVRQLRLRDIGGIIVIDFIDMVLESNRDLVLRRLVECLGRDRTKHQVAEVTSLGLVQMTRKRVGQGLVEAFSETCEHCNGRGFVVHSDPIERGSNGGGSHGGGSHDHGRGSSNGGGSHDHGRGAEPVESDGDEGRPARSRRRRGGAAAKETAPVAPAAPEPTDEAREAVKATLATIAAAAAHAHDHEHEAHHETAPVLSSDEPAAPRVEVTADFGIVLPDRTEQAEPEAQPVVEPAKGAGADEASESAAAVDASTPVTADDAPVAD